MTPRLSTSTALSVALLLSLSTVVSLGATATALGQTGAPSKDAVTPEAAPKSANQLPPADGKPVPAPQGGTAAVVMDLSALESVIGKSVKSASGEDLGRIVDLLVTTSGQVRAAVIDFGGFLGVGSRKVAVDWKALNFANFTKDGTVRLALTRNQVRVSPEYKSGDPVVILQAGKPEEPKAEGAKPVEPPTAKPPSAGTTPEAGGAPQTPDAGSASPPKAEPGK